MPSIMPRWTAAPCPTCSRNRSTTLAIVQYTRPWGIPNGSCTVRTDTVPKRQRPGKRADSRASSGRRRGRMPEFYDVRRKRTSAALNAARIAPGIARIVRRSGFRTREKRVTRRLTGPLPIGVPRAASLLPTVRRRHKESRPRRRAHRSGLQGAGIFSCRSDSAALGSPIREIRGRNRNFIIAPRRLPVCNVLFLTPNRQEGSSDMLVVRTAASIIAFWLDLDL